MHVNQLLMALSQQGGGRVLTAYLTQCLLQRLVPNDCILKAMKAAALHVYSQGMKAICLTEPRQVTAVWT